MKEKKILRIFIILFGLFAFYGTSISALTLVSPASSARCVEEDATFIWNKPVDVVKYSFKISTSSSFNVDSTVIVNNLTDTTITPFVFQGTNLKSNTFYYWQVTATLINSQILSSLVYSFNTLVHPVTLAEPINDICCLDLKNTFKIGTEYSKVDSLRIIIAANSTMQDVIIDTIVANPTVTAGVMSLSLTMPFYATDYYWVAKQAANRCWSDMTPEAAQHFCTRHGAPVLTTPTNGTIGIPYFGSGLPFNVRLNWKPMSGALNYVIQLSTTSNFAAYTQYWSADTTELIALPADYNKTYFWRVLAKTNPITLINEVIDSCNSITSSAFSFLTPIQPITLSLPADGANCVPIITNASWVAVPEAQFYQLQVSRSAGFENDSIVIDMSNITTNSATLNLPIGIFGYHWRVRVKNPSNIGLWSAVRIFQSTTETPVAVYPLSGATGIPRVTTLKWAMGKASSSYRLMISEDVDFDQNLVDTLLTTNEFSYKFPNYSSKYYWKVMSIFGVCQGAWSNTFNFRTYLDAPTLLSPKNDTTKYEPILVAFNWVGALGTESYDVDLSEDSTFSELFRFERNIPVVYVIYDNMKENTKYWWRVRGRNAEGVSEWSEVFRLTTGSIRPDVPVPISPNNGAYKLPIDTVNLVWSTASLANRYILQVSKSPDFSTFMVNTDTLTGTTYFLSNLENNKLYYWRIAASNIQGMSDFSGTWSFRTIPIAPNSIVILTEPANGSKNLINKIQTLKWESIPNIDTYELWIAFDADFTDFYYKNDIVWNTYKTLFNLIPVSTYYWKVRGTNDGGVGPWSETWNFTTEDPASVKFNNIFSTEIIPSPVLSIARVKLSLTETSDITFEVMDIQGNIVLKNEFKQLQEGSNEFELNAKLLSSGTYIYKISAGSKIEFGKFVVSK